MKREAIFSKAIWTAKKRYAMIVHNSEGVDYHPYKLKIMGMDIVKSSTPKAIRGELKSILVKIFESTEPELQEYVAGFKKKFMEMPIEDVAFPRGVNTLNKYARGPKKPGKPIAVTAAITYNTYASKDKTLTPIKDGDKIRFVYLKQPNPTHSHVIGFPAFGTLPPSLKLDKFVDYGLQWEKVFLSPLKGITNAIGWDVEPKSTLDDFFS